MALMKQAYNLFFKRSSTFALSIVLGAIFFERFFDQVGDAVFDHLNDGKLWKHIKHKYEKNEEE
ncbi:cytochrome b-c1 complex subunit 9 [Heptranchias perlo]|uniref:cytochrome b-c1 complex subunit 9 n=1 Tax=Heptranchias perlo TaxID=212740 RepID=UPI00355A1D9A